MVIGINLYLVVLILFILCNVKCLGEQHVQL